MRPKMEFEHKLKRALDLDLPYFERPLDREGRAAAVMVLLGWSGLSAGEPSILLSRRTESVETHKGQIAFPGGVVDPEDASAVDAALRETEEEIGLSPSAIRVIGELPRLWTVTGFWITPVVGILLPSIEEVVFGISEAEIAETFWISMKELTAPGIYREEPFSVGKITYPVHIYQIQERRIWGATGAMLKNLLDRIELLG